MVPCRRQSEFQSSIIHGCGGFMMMPWKMIIGPSPQEAWIHGSRTVIGHCWALVLKLHCLKSTLHFQAFFLSKKSLLWCLEYSREITHLLTWREDPLGWWSQKSFTEPPVCAGWLRPSRAQELPRELHDNNKNSCWSLLRTYYRPVTILSSLPNFLL